MKEYKDIHGYVVKAGDMIKMPHVKEEGYNIDEHGYYTTRVFYNENRDCLVDDNGMGFRLAFGVELIKTADKC